MKNKLMENMLINMDDVKKILDNMSKYHIFYDQMKRHELRQKEIKDELHEKLLKIQNSEKNIV